MRICSPQLGLAPNSVLGGEVFDREILLGLAKKGIEIEIIIPKNKPHDKIPNWKINYFPISHFPAFFYNFFILPYLIKIYLNKPFDILRIHQPQFIGLGSAFFKLFFPKVKLVATYHQFRETKFGFLSKAINNYWDFVICDSENVKKRILTRYKVSQNRVAVVHNGVPKYLKPVRKNLKLIKKLRLENSYVILFMGLFNQRKNPLFLLDVLPSILKRNENVVLIYWGKGTLKKKIIQRAKSIKIIQNIRIINPVYGPAKNQIHNLADIFVHPSKDEGFALAPLESMACAKPILITDAFSAKEAVTDGLNGFLLRSNDTNHWSEKIIDLVNNKRLMEKMGQASLSKVKKEFQWQFAVKKHIDVFNHLIK